MDCRRFRRLISSWIDEILDKQEQEDFIQHMEDCKQCRIELKQYQNMISLIRNMEEVKLPEGFHERLHIELENQVKQNGNFSISISKGLLKWMGAVAAIFVLLFSIRIFDSIGLMGAGKTKDNVDIESMESSDGASGLNIASISDSGEKSSGRKNKFKEEVQMQEKTDSCDIADNIIEFNNESDNSVLEDNTSSNNKIYTLANNMEDKGVSKQEIMDNGTADDDISDDAEDKNGIIHIPFKDSNNGMIETDLVKVKVQDVCITPSTLKMMAVNNGIQVLKSTENSVILELSNLEEREILYKELSRLGEIEDSGDKTNSMEVTIVIVREE